MSVKTIRLKPEAPSLFTQLATGTSCEVEVSLARDLIERGLAESVGLPADAPLKENLMPSSVPAFLDFQGAQRLEQELQEEERKADESKRRGELSFDIK